MQLGNFSVSLAVKDIAASRAFHETLGFRQIAGNQAQNPKASSQSMSRACAHVALFDIQMQPA